MEPVAAVGELHACHLPDELPVAMMAKLAGPELPLGIARKAGRVAKYHLTEFSGIPDSPRGVAVRRVRRGGCLLVREGGELVGHDCYCTSRTITPAAATSSSS